jgi:ABC-type dipeptide/oligopeptide/nickel transport system permease subunit
MERVEQTGAVAAGGGRAPVVDEVDLIPVRTYWQLVRQRFLQHRLAVIALVILAILLAFAIIVPLLTGDLYKRAILAKVNAGPTLDAPFGYNEIGQNMFIRLAKATQTSLLIGVAAVLIIAGIGIVVGAIAGFFGGWIDNLLMRFVDIVLTLPTLFIILMIVAFFGRGDVRVVIIAIGITGWTLAARLIRAEFLALREADFVQAARALGAGKRRIIMRHMLPAALAPLVVATALGVADSVIVEAALSFLGFGISPPDASLGNMLNGAQEYFFSAPIRIVYPGVALILLVMSASFIGDGLRDALDPRQRVHS